MRGRVVAMGLVIAVTAAGHALASGDWLEGGSSRALVTELDQKSRIVVRRQDGTGERSFDLPGTCRIAYAPRSRRWLLFGIGEIGTNVYVTRIAYIDEAKLALTESVHGLTKDGFRARALEISADGEYVAFVGSKGGEPARLVVLRTSSDTMKTLGPPPPPVPADPGAYDPAPKNWSDDAFDDVMQLAEGMMSFPSEDALRVAYARNKGNVRTWDLRRVFASAK